MSDKDFKSLFKAAKSARGGPQKLSKEQIKVLKAQKARAPSLAGQSAPAAGRGAERDAGTMPPPPPRQPSSKPPSQQPSAASFHADSQATRMYNGGGAAPSAHPEPSVNQGPHLAQAAAASRQGSVRSTAGMFPGSNAASVAGSSGAAARAMPRDMPAAAVEGAEGGAPQQQAEAAVSLEGSSGAVAGAAGGTADLTSALSSQQQAAMRGQPSVASAVPAGFFDEAAAALSAIDTGVVSSPPPERGASGDTTAAAAGNDDPGSGAALPKGFFEDKAADAKARGEVPKTKKEMDKEFADFLKQVDADAAEAAAQKAAEDAAEAVDKQDREEFEHIVRLQRIEDLRRAKAAGAEEPSDDLAARARAAVSDPDVNMPAIQLPKKRKVADTLAELERDSMSEGDSDVEEPEELLDWRAKKSAF